MIKIRRMQNCKTMLIAGARRQVSGLVLAPPAIASCRSISRCWPPVLPIANRPDRVRHTVDRFLHKSSKTSASRTADAKSQ